MRKLLVAVLVLAFPATALGFDCVQSDGQAGWWNGTTADDAGCVTQTEYETLYSIDNLIAIGVVDQLVDNGDGTFSLVNPSSELEPDPLDRPVAATPRFEPDAPTVGEVLFDRHPGSGGPQEF